jgi:hypothetical protein
MSAELDGTETRPRRLSRDPAEQRVAELVRVLSTGGAKALQGTAYGGTLVLRELVLGENGLGRTAQILQEIRIDHGATDEFVETCGHSATDDTTSLRGA